MSEQFVPTIRNPAQNARPMSLTALGSKGRGNPGYRMELASRPHPQDPWPSPHLSEDRPDQRGQALGPRLPLGRLSRLQKQDPGGVS